METIFYILFRSSHSAHDRIEYFKQHKTLEDFMHWHNDKRKEVEKEYGAVVVENFDIKYFNEVTAERSEIEP